MDQITGQLAAIMASTDAVPRLVRQSSSNFLVTPQGQVWRIFDSDDANGGTRHSPGTDPFARTRIFMGSGPAPVLRLYEFRQDETRTVAAEQLYEQMLASRVTE